MAATGGNTLTTTAAFADFLKATGEAYMSGPDRIINLASKRNYFWSVMLMGMESNPMMIQDGTNITEKAIAAPMGKATFHKFGATYTFSGQEGLVRPQAYWRQASTDVQWNEAEIMNNVRQSREGAAAVFVNMKKVLEQQLVTDLWNGKETALWKAPSATMEGDDNASNNPEPNSIPFLVNAFPNGIIPGETTRLGLTPVANSLIPEQGARLRTYANSTPDDEGNPVNQLSRLVRECRFMPPPSFKEYWETPEYRKQVIVTSLEGMTKYENLLRYGQDRFVAGRQDPDYNAPMMKGVALFDASELDDPTLAIYANTAGDNYVGSNGTGAGTAGVAGPRYFVLNFNYLYPVIHRERWFYKREVQRAVGTLDTWQLPMSSWYNIFETSLGLRQGLLSPV